MNDPIRVDLLASDDRLLDAVAARSYAGSDPLATMLLTYARACDSPAPATRPAAGRRRIRRAVISGFASMSLLVSGVSAAAAVSDRLPQPVIEWATEHAPWWARLAILTDPNLPPVGDGQGLASMPSATVPTTRPGAASTTAQTGPTDPTEPDQGGASAEAAGGPTPDKRQADPAVTSPAATPTGPATPTAAADKEANGNLGKSTSAPGRTAAPGEGKGGASGQPSVQANGGR